MKSSTGYYSSPLDHVRGLAAYLVCFWHFTHLTIPTSHVPLAFPVSLFEEGHTGVALFMTLSGFLFARIAGEKEIDIGAFARNRFLRLAPLLVVSFVMYLALGETTLLALAQGFVLPVWPGVAWSIAPELHFYLMFPLLLLLTRKFGTRSILLLVGLAIAIRLIFWAHTGEVQRLAYWSIVGRVDQFLWGVLFGQLVSRRGMTALGGRNAAYIAGAIVLAFLVFWHTFNSWGGFYHLHSYPSPSPLWVVLPSIEGFAYAFLIAWYSEADIRLPRRLDRLLAMIGTISFSIYIWHWPLREPVARFFDSLGLSREDFVSASLLSTVYFALVAVVSIASYWLIEKPFLSLRVNYIRRPSTSPSEPPARQLSAKD